MSFAAVEKFTRARQRRRVGWLVKIIVTERRQKSSSEIIDGQARQRLRPCVTDPDRRRRVGGESTKTNARKQSVRRE